MTGSENDLPPDSDTDRSSMATQADPPAAVIRACFELITYVANGGPATLAIDKAMSVDDPDQDLGAWKVTISRD